MAIVEMNIHRALAEMKMYEKRFYDNTNRLVFVKTCLKNNGKVEGMTKEKYKDMLKANFKQTQALLKNYNALKAAVTLSNATTKVTINNKEYTVAEAINRKHSIAMEKAFVDALARQLAKEKQKIDFYEATFNEKFSTYTSNMVKEKFSKEMLEELEKSFRNANDLEILDVNGLCDFVQSYRDEISVFETTVDFTLSESNAVTMIKVDFED